MEDDFYFLLLYLFSKVAFRFGTKVSARPRRLSPKWIWGLWLCLAALLEQQKVFLD